jgi:hypothetical protein
MTKKITLAIVSTSSLSAGITQAQIISSGPLNILQTFPTNSATQTWRVGVGILSTNTPDFAFGFDGFTVANTQKPYIDARADLSAPLGNMSGLQGDFSGKLSMLAYGNNGFPLCPGGTLIDATYAATYPPLTSASTDDQRGYFYQEANGNFVGDWGPTNSYGNANSTLVDGYVGIILSVNSTNDYGYLHFLIDNPGVSVTLEDWAYQSTPGVGIETPPVSVNISQVVGGLQLTWGGTGQLLEASSLGGPWTTNSPATSPYLVSPMNSQSYYRILVPSTVSLP